MERQKHGKDYERFIIERKSLKETKYTDKWDGFNVNGIPLSVKLIKDGNNIYLGSIERQFAINNDFILCIGFWKNKTENIIKEYEIKINHIIWNSYFGDMSILKEVYNEMKNISNDKSDDKIWKKFYEKYKKLYGESIIKINFKRDHKNQKRVQCSIKYKDFIKIILKDNEILEIK